MTTSTWSLAALPRKIVFISSILGLVACGGGTENVDGNPDDNNDGSGGSGSQNAAPIADAINTTNTSGMAPLTVNFNGTASRDSDGSIVSYEWTFGDLANSTSTSIVESFTFNQPGSYQATLSVVDDGGLESTDTVVVTVLSANAPNNMPPVSNILVSDASGTVPLTVNFDGSGSADTDGTINSYTWDFGNGETAVGRSVTHEFTEAGSFLVRLTVVDNDNISGSSTVTINAVEPSASNNPPDAELTLSANDGLNFDFTARNSSDPDGDALSYLWNMGDNTQYSDRDISHSYGVAGTYRVSLTVTDENGESDVTTQTVTATANDDNGGGDNGGGDDGGGDNGGGDNGGGDNGSTVPQFTDFVANAANGESEYNSMCSGCHGQTGVLLANGGDAVNALDVNKYTTQTLFLKIHDEMPVLIGSPTDCEDQCAADVAAHLESWRDTFEVTCDSTSPLTYSPRRLTLLTTEEYQNTLEDVLGIEQNFTDAIISDATKGNFPNNSTANVDENRANKYFSAAENIASLAVANDLPFPCGVNDNCSEEFINNVAFRMFRRPLTEDEKANLQSVFDQADNGKEGMELGLVAVLNAPQFLYRSELGELVSTVLSTDPEPFLRPIPATSRTFYMGDTEDFTQVNYYVGGEFDYTFGSNDIVTIALRATPDNNGAFPNVTLRISNKEVPNFTVDSTSPKTYSFTFDDLEGQGARIDLNAPPNLSIGKITFGQTELFTPARGDEAKMELADNDAYILDPFEYASVLSYTLTGTAPDQELMDAAMNDGLHFEDQIRAQVDRLLDSPRGQERMGVFAGLWFNTDRVVTSDVNRDTALFPNYTTEVRESMAEEVRALFREIFYGDRPFDTLYSGDFTVVNSILADYYNISSNSTGPDDWQVVDNIEERGGILTTGAFMTVNAHPDKSAPIVRAVRTREQALCQHIAPPPLLVDDREALLELAEEEYRQGIATTRRYYEVITDSPACAGCHEKQINPMFGTEDFDQVGQYRTTQIGSTGLTLDIDASGILYGPEDVTDTSSFIEFEGAKGLSKAIASLPGVDACLMEKSFRFVAGMPLTSTAVDSTFEAPLTEAQASDFKCASDKAEAAYKSSGESPRSVITEFIMQDLMRYRKAK